MFLWLLKVNLTFLLFLPGLLTLKVLTSASLIKNHTSDHISQNALCFSWRKPQKPLNAHGLHSDQFDFYSLQALV